MMNIDQLVFSSKDNESEQSQINTKFMDNEEGFTLRKWNQVNHLSSYISKREVTNRIFVFIYNKFL
jgi:hypothetical protein